MAYEDEYVLREREIHYVHVQASVQVANPRAETAF